MFDDTLLEDLVRAGVSDELLGRVKRLQFSAESLRISAEKMRFSAERSEQRKSKDRERKRKAYEKTKKSKQIAKANDVAVDLDSPRRTGGTADFSAENVAICVVDKESKKVEFNKENKKVSKSSTVLNSTELTNTSRLARGARIPPDWQPPATLIEWCRVRGIVGARLDELVAEFIDYWIAVPGQRGCKLDWPATFRNRVRTKVPAASAPAAVAGEPIWKQPPAKFLERQREREANGQAIGANSRVGKNGSHHQEELQLSGGGSLRGAVPAAQGSPPGHHKRDA